MNSSQGNEDAFLVAVENFGAGRAQWLKIASGQKGELLVKALESRTFVAGEIVLELGTFVGFSTIRMASSLARVTNDSMKCARVVTVEKESGCARLAASIINRVGLASSTEVWTGRAADMLPRVLEEYGAGSVGLAFFDHSGSVYHDDLVLLEDLGLLAPGAIIIADNVLKPGTPLFLWHIIGSAYEVRLLSVREFVQTSVEDWVAICVWRGEKSSSGWAPNGISQLAWQTDAMRRRSERGNASVADWASFAHHVKCELRQHGIEAMPWLGFLG